MPTKIIREDLGVQQFAVRLGLSRWQLRVGREHGILPAPDLDGERWSAELVDEIETKGAEVVAMFGNDPPVGAVRAAEDLAKRIGLDVERSDVEVLVARGVLNVVSKFRGHPVYLRSALDALDADAVREVVAARKGPLLDSVDAGGAAAILDWPRKTFDRIASERELATDRLGRYSLSDVRELASDEILMRRVADEKRRLALAKNRRAETRIEDTVRSWLMQCTAYVDRVVDQPPDTATIGRTLRSLAAARERSAEHELDAP